ncbi:uncharacterized protein LOC125940389 [Dermacentor silvarum]|uniref:uncharacterized protein LOC125940389 n=1 Tax=Dermacentor silvarum TaxID=543639 RepID=UPI00210099AC|nr:uncharacterized protein LOC125940389 [Dermacentor silvarum]
MDFAELKAWNSTSNEAVCSATMIFNTNSHVHGVREKIMIATDPSNVVGRCVTQMKSVDFNVQLQLSSRPRHIMGASCTCKAGCRGWCKHGAALPVFGLVRHRLPKASFGAKKYIVHDRDEQISNDSKKKKNVKI